ncbi:protein phosphatase 2C domain-containing protein [uncultured Pantoea sp.]|uniref:PP2C family protein-serine/threonine phosphatase n=1 Tax=uncultured Pantoea sp. TaxID=218084 RepID=UPI002588B91B|nr:protein phosphatase 2C domain-containing protein [uncultured Pantoea sp.]
MIELINEGFFSYPKDINRGNQDHFLLPKQLNDGYLLAVADGVGSYPGAKAASELAIEVISSLQSAELIDVAYAMNSILSQFERLHTKNAEWIRAATTLSFCFVDSNFLHIGHVGDTRVYVKKGNKLVLVTKDHTQHQELLDDGLFTKKELKKMPGKNSLTAALSKILPLRFQTEKISLSDLIEDNGLINIYIMSDGAHHYWEKRPRLSINTISKAPFFASSILRRIEKSEPIDDYTLIAASFKIS